MIIVHSPYENIFFKAMANKTCVSFVNSKYI